MQFHSHAGTFIACGLALLLATGLYQRVANPSLEYHLNHGPSASSASSAPSMPPDGMAPGAETPEPMSAGEREKLAKAMADLRENPANAETHMLIADIFLRHKDWHKAIRFMERAVAVAPDNATAWHAYGFVLFGHKEFEKSGEAFERALVLKPGYASAMTNLIILYRQKLGKPERAKELAKAVLASPDADEHAQNIARDALQKAQ